MEKQQTSTVYEQAVRVLPPVLRLRAMQLPEQERCRAEEIRLRVGQPLSVVLGEREQNLGDERILPGDITQLVELASQASVHAVLPQLRQGYLSVRGGHRIGLCGTAVMREGAVHSFGRYSGANLRIAREFPGVAGPLLEVLWPRGEVCSTLILSPPGLGKTTLLRDLVRSLSRGEVGVRRRVSLVDERGEVAAMSGGFAQLDVGPGTDVMEGCPKAQAMLMMLRAMNPQILAVDEITAPEDIKALESAQGCGVKLLATAHGCGREDLERRGLYRQLLEKGLVEKLVLIRRQGEQRIYRVEELR